MDILNGMDILKRFQHSEIQCILTQNELPMLHIHRSSKR